MTEQHGAASDWHTYRCPVCGHTDEVSLGAPEGTVACSHCGTELDVHARARDEAAVAVRLARRRRRAP